jgi:DNA repair exonuclease SbcCD nuclease subunit
LRLAHLSDVHYDGSPRGLELLDRALGAADDKGADHLLLAGDLIDFADRRLLEELTAVLRASRWWDPARLTVLPGNHDLYRHSYPNFLRCVMGGFPSLRSTTETFDRIYRDFMGTPIGTTALPALKQLDSDWHLLLLDTLIKTHRFDFMGSWRGWLDPELTQGTQAALAEVDPKLLVIAGHHFPMPESSTTTRLLRGTSFHDDNFPEVIRLLDGLSPTPKVYLCGHIHSWGEGAPEAFDTEQVAGVPVYCQGRTGGVDGIAPSWTLHTFSSEGARTSTVHPISTDPPPA